MDLSIFGAICASRFFLCLQNYSIVIEGVSGRVAYEVNGVYDPTSETSGGYPIFVKRNDKRKWLEYNADLQRWQVKPTAGKGVDMCWAYLDGDFAITAKEGGPLPTLWTFRGEGGGWTEQKEAAAVEVENGDAIKLTGFGGQHSKKICGVYAKIQPENSSFPSYESRGADGVRLIEYHSETRTWQLKPASCRGQDSCWAYVFNRSGAPPPTSTTAWVVKDSFDFQSTARISIEAYDAKFRIYGSSN
jgi:hypothetical protein